MWANESIRMIVMYPIRGLFFGKEGAQANRGQMLEGKSYYLISVLSFLMLYQELPCLGFWPQIKFVY